MYTIVLCCLIICASIVFLTIIALSYHDDSKNNVKIKKGTNYCFNCRYRGGTGIKDNYICFVEPYVDGGFKLCAVRNPNNNCSDWGFKGKRD